jgi:hypothetical protein
MTASEKGNQYLPDHIFMADNYLANFLLDTPEDFLKLCGIHQNDFP